MSSAGPAQILILFATREGQTAKIAKRIATDLEAAGAQVSLLDAAGREATSGIDLSAFDLLVFGASMHAGGLERELVSFINAHSRAIAALPRSLFLVLLSAATEDPELRSQWLGDALTKLNSQLEVEFSDIETIAGALRYSRYNWPMKWLMQRIARQAGADTDIHKDYEYTDWQQVADYARRLAGRLQ
jgi:menaquinone-dependent protoporphyrinogen oxidase